MQAAFPLPVCLMLLACCVAMSIIAMAGCCRSYAALYVLLLREFPDARHQGVFRRVWWQGRRGVTDARFESLLLRTRIYFALYILSLVATIFVMAATAGQLRPL